jgi:arginine dihydrolase
VPSGQPGPVRHFLMCPPAYFTVSYTINPWMNPAKPTDTGLAIAQWDRLRQVYASLGHQVRLIDPEPGLPDMVFTANGATVIGGRALAARFRHLQRAGEVPAMTSWLRQHGYQVHEPSHHNEGEGDLLFAGDRILAGQGFRTDGRSHGQIARLFGLPVVSLTLIDPRFYHLDTALTVLRPGQVMYYPPAFDAASVATLRQLYPGAVVASDADAEVLGLNAVSDGRHVILSELATHLHDELRERGFTTIGVDLSELLKAGGGPKCCTLELRQ